MRIDIIVTRDDGSTITIADNQQIANLDQSGQSRTGARLWHMRPDFKAIRSLTQDEAWAASFLCAQMGMRHLPVCPDNLHHLKAAAAFNEPSDYQRARDEELGRIAERQTYKPGEVLKRDTGELHTTSSGDAQIAVVADG